MNFRSSFYILMVNMFGSSLPTWIPVKWGPGTLPPQPPAKGWRWTAPSCLVGRWSRLSPRWKANRVVWWLPDSAQVRHSEFMLVWMQLMRLDNVGVKLWPADQIWFLTHCYRWLCAIYSSHTAHTTNARIIFWYLALRSVEDVHCWMFLWPNWD